ncbi:MAG: HipA domain-containing protein, partial [Desulfatiglandales bacterium]|nr:HipA domain-containing protein [Desulfatiglandales bacterium]
CRFNLTSFNYFVGNEDMPLKNFTVIRSDLKVELSPAYGLLNSTIILNSQEELALPLGGKKNKLVYISAILRPFPSKYGWIEVFHDFINNKTRFNITLNYARGTKEGVDYYLQSWPRLKRKVEALRKRWTMQGSPIIKLYQKEKNK